MIINIQGHNVQCSLFLSDIHGSLIFSTKFREIPQITNFMKILPVGIEFFHADGRTDRQTDRHDEANDLLSQFCERAPEFSS